MSMLKSRRCTINLWISITMVCELLGRSTNQYQIQQPSPLPPLLGCARLTNIVETDFTRDFFEGLYIAQLRKERRRLRLKRSQKCGYLPGLVLSITLARDQPIKHKNLAFKDLIEGYNSNRYSNVSSDGSPSSSAQLLLKRISSFSSPN
jgi:hypothetical protein